MIYNKGAKSAIKEFINKHKEKVVVSLPTTSCIYHSTFLLQKIKWDKM